MKLGIIYGEISTKHQLIMERAEEVFDSVLAAPIDGIKFVHGPEENKVLYKDIDLTEFDAVYVRTSDGDMQFSEHLTEVLNEEGVVTQAENDTYSYESNKFYSMKIMAESGLKTPNSVYTLSPDVAVEAAEGLGYPVIMKTVRGAGGEGVMRASSENELKPVMDTMKSFEQEIVLQEFREHGGCDTRLTVIGDEVYGYRRSNESDDWRSNVHAGGKRVEADIDDEMEKVALTAARSTGFDICGCDVIGDSEEGYYVLEVNGAFGLSEEMNEIIGRDVVLDLVERMHEKAMEKRKEKS